MPAAFHHEILQADLNWDYEARKYLCGIIVEAGTACLTAGIGETYLYKPAFFD